MENNSSVLVTGGSGFLAGYVAAELLRRGHHVRVSVRNLARADAVRARIGRLAEAATLDVAEADLLNDRGWAAAADGMDYVVHTASPMPIGEFRNQDVVRPAREGTRRVLTAARDAGVRRVVLTSSTAAAMPADRDAPADESVWTDLPDRPEYVYPRAKTLAERDAWDLVRGWPDGPELATVLPANIQGPAVDDDYAPSIALIRMMLTGRLPLLPRLGYSIVDVRDLAVLHADALTDPAAAGQRFIAAGEFLWFSEIAAVLRAGLGGAARRVPRHAMPNWLVHAGALVNAEMRQMRPSLDRRSNLIATHAERVLGWRTRPAAESILDAGRSLITLGLV
ncbi:NAD-dependent epimerase/dehydratase family protein [Catenuloplanes indicus]|uniref:Dihydroflavonol-4-reductase n=1 Tax=Catenuloplanes indicus TaxID=137267 RepID=A0AAE3VUD7_9ACTN|nr:NAD-dependent epimerase/dehydratase family protein [Catenuloplanes indicus]MDQ0364011.1 dihydroflavonol-4-reductase [Catenuloplanes indicus]